MGENAADLAGLTVAHDAYMPRWRKEPPVIDGTTGDQRFYGSAQVWRRNYREANFRQRLITDPHSPSEQRDPISFAPRPMVPGVQRAAGPEAYILPADRVRIW